MALVGYVDDSGSSDGNVFVLAGYVSSADQWDSFSDEWESICNEEPQTPDFKMTKAFKDHYKWSAEERDKRIDNLALCIARHTEYRIDARVLRADYERIVRGKLISEIDSPYYVLFYHVILATAHFMNEAGIEGTIDWVFDEQAAIGRSVRDWYYRIKNLAPLEYQRRLGGEPIFKDDTQVLPLKAADMLAWHLRRSHNEEHPHPIRSDQGKIKNIPILTSMPGGTCNVREEDLRQLVNATINTLPLLQASCHFFYPPDKEDDS